MDDTTIGDEFGKWLVETVMGSMLGFVWKAFDVKTGHKLADGEDYFQQLSDFVTGKITDSMDKSMDKDPDFTKDDIEEALSEILTLEQEGLNRFTLSIFNASKDSIEDRKAFEFAIGGGAWLKTRSLTNLDLEKKAVSYLFNQLIPEFWQKRPNMAPVIIKSDDPDDNSNPFAQNVFGSPGYQRPFLNDEQAAAARLHTDGHTFWLAATKRCDSWSNNRDFGWVCNEPEDNQWFIQPPGIEELGPDSAWGVYKDDMIMSAWAGYKRNGNKNGCKWDLIIIVAALGLRSWKRRVIEKVEADYVTLLSQLTDDPQKDPEGRRSDTDGATFMYGDGPRTPGVNKIPISNYIHTCLQEYRVVVRYQSQSRP